MQLLRIETKNFRQLADVEIHFPQTGLIGIIGDNGAGKSTILNLLDWVFYGKYKEITQAQLKTRGALKNAPTYVVVDMIFNNSFYRVRRDLSNSASKNIIQKDGMTVANGTTQINDYVRDTLFRMDQDSFRTCYYAAQDEFDSLVKLNDTPRIKMISRFFKIEAIDAAAEKARKDKRALEIQIDEFKRHLKDEDFLKEQIENTKKELETYTSEVKVIEKTLTDLDNKRLLLVTQKEKSDKQYEEFREVSSSISNMEIKKTTLVEHSLKSTLKELEELVTKRERLSSISESKNKYFSLIQRKDSLNTDKEQFVSVQRLEKQLSDIREAINQYEQTVKEASEKVETFTTIEEQSQKIEATIKEKDEALAEMRDEVQELLTILKVKKEEYETKKSAIEDFEELGTDAPCPTCKQSLGKEHFEDELTKLKNSLKETVLDIKEKRGKYEILSEKGISEKENLQSLKDSLKNLNTQLSAKSGYLARKENAESELNKQKNLLSSVTTERATLPEKIDFDREKYNQLLQDIRDITPLYEEVIQLEKAVEKIPQVESAIEELKSQISDLTTEMELKNADLLKLDFNKEIHMKISSDLEEVRSVIDQKRDEKYNSQSQVDISKNRIATYETEYNEVLTKKKELSKKQDEVIMLTKLDQLYKTYKTDKLAGIAPTLQDLMSDMINFLTDGRYDSVELDNNYKINVYRNRELLPFEMFSGGEKKLFALCLRLAISQSLVAQTEQSTFDMITLDEVFESFNEKRQDAMIDMFRNLSNIFKQILVVSHNEHVKNLYDHILQIEFDPRTHTSKIKWLNNDLNQPTFDHDYIEQLVYEKYELDAEDTSELEASGV